MTASRRCLALALMLMVALAALSPHACARKSILLVFDEDKDLPGLAVINRSLREVFRTELKGDVEFYSESLNVSQFKAPGYDEALRQHFSRKYAGVRPDLIVAVMEPSLDFLVRHREALFPGVPIVICGADSTDIDRAALKPDVTGLLVKRTYAPTLDVALRLRPQTRNVHVVGGTSRFDQRLQALARRDFDAYKDRLSFTWLTGLPMDELLKRVSSLPADSIVIYLTVFTDGAGHAFVPHEALSVIARTANAPVFVSVDQYVGSGAVGGHVYSVDLHGRHAAEIGLRILRGEPASKIPVVELATYADLFDWRELQRWRIDERRVPDGSTVLFRPASAWELYRWYIVGGVLVVVVESALIVGLLLNRRLRLQAERARRRAEDEAQRQREELAHALRLTTLGELTASIAHELSQPLTSIGANAQAARRLLGADEEARREVDEALGDIAKASDQAAQTIHRLRALFRKQPTERVPVDINALIDDVLGLLRADIRRKRIAVRSTRAEAPPPVLADAIQLRQVLMNLIVNAEEAIALAGDGPREIHIDTSGSDTDHVRIAVSDTGVGIEASDLERMFEHFVSTKPHGLGMGLAISRSIVEAHDGSICASLNEGPGLTLRVELPVRAR